MKGKIISKKKFNYLVVFLATILVGGVIFFLSGYCPSAMHIKMKTSKTGKATVYFGSGQQLSFKVKKSEEFKTYAIPLPETGITPMKLSPINKIAVISISEIQLRSFLTNQIMSDQHLAQNLELLKDIKGLPNKNYFSGKTLSQKALLHIGKAAEVNKVPLIIRLGLAIFFMFFTFLLVGQRLSDTRANPKKLKYIALVLILAPVILGFAYVFLFGVNIPYYDEWVVVQLFEKYQTGELNFSDFYAQHNEHRILFPRVILLIIGILSRFDTVIEMYFIQVLVATIMIVLFLKLKNQFGFSMARIPAWIIPVPFLIYSWRQYENFLWGLMIAFVLPIAASVLSFFFLDRLNKPYEKKLARKHWRNFALGVIFTVVSSFSMAMGLLAWAAGIFQLLSLPGKNPKKYLYFGIWTFLGILTWIGYFLGYMKPANHPSLFYVLSHPVETFKSFLIFLGSSLYWDESLSFATGLILFIIAVILVIIIAKKGLVRENSFWLTLLLFSFLVVGAILVGRAGFGKDALLWSRYTTYSIPIVVSLYVLSVNLIYKKPRSKIVKIILVVLLILITTGSVFSYVNGYKVGKEWHLLRKSQAVNILTIETKPDQALKGIFPSIPVLRYLAKKMKMLNYSVYREKYEYFIPGDKGHGNRQKENEKRRITNMRRLE